MHTQTPPLTARPSLGRRLAQVFRPGSIGPRAEAAASLPIWVAGPISILSIYLLAETIVNNVVTIDSLGRPFTSESRSALPRLRVWHEVFSSEESFLVSLVVLGLILLGLEVVNLLVMAPFGVPMGQTLRSRLGQCRKVLYALGGVWLMQGAVLWTVVCLLLVPPLYWSVISPAVGEHYYISKVLTAAVFYIALPLAMLLGLEMRLMRACNCLAGESGQPPAPLCGGCGYQLEGLAAGAGCPECGLADPTEPDRARVATPWAASHGVGRISGLVQTVLAVGLQPSRFFRRMQVWGQAKQGRRFACWTIWLSMPLAALSLPGVMVAWGPSPMDTDDWYMVPVVMAIIALVVALVIVVFHGLLIALVGWGISRARQEPAWPIAATAGAYLAGLVPWVAAGQALWLWPFFLINNGIDNRYENTIADLCEVAGRSLRIAPEILFIALLLLPTILGFFLAVRTAVVCCRGVRYACR